MTTPPDDSTRVVFPYRSLGHALRDRWAKIGGPEQAFRFLVQGYKFLEWRKRWAKRRQERERQEDEDFAAENGGGLRKLTTFRVSDSSKKTSRYE